MRSESPIRPPSRILGVAEGLETARALPAPRRDRMKTVAVCGASGPPGRFIVAELVRRGLRPILLGRDARRLASVAGDLPTRVAPIELSQRDLAGIDALILCAGPFAVTAAPVIEATLTAGVPYLDIAAEPDVVADLVPRFDGRGGVVATGLGFYGGLGDLLVTAVIGEWPSADEVTLAYALSSWKPTPGTRETIRVAGERRRGQRLVFADGKLGLRSDAAARRPWTFPAPMGTKEVVADFTTADAVTLPRHLRIGELHELMTTAPLAD